MSKLLNISPTDISIIRKTIENRYKTMPIEQKIDLAEFALTIQLEDGHKNVPISLMKIIKLLSEKIMEDHCE